MTFIKCSKCGNRIDSKVNLCPRCGNTINEIKNNLIVPKKIQNYFAIIGAILSLISIYVFFVSLIAITFCILGIKKSKELNKDGLALSIVSLIIGIMYLFVFVMTFFD